IEAWFNLGLSYFVWQNYIDAIDAYKNVVQRDPSHFTAWGNLALSYFAHDDYKNGLDAALKAYNLKNDELWLVANLIIGYLFTGDSTKALEFTDILLTMPDNKDSILSTLSFIENAATRHPQIEGLDAVLSKLRGVAIPMMR
ncbi:MAG: tetratricopeptide repeat protein, partial [Chitinispirillaceae bacterium]|nr:tetratricopeptide repeat protein [Chitinispirillaceae bacterium]